MSNTTVVDLASFRNKKAAHESYSGKRKPLDTTHGLKNENGDLSERLTRIRSSLDRINRLMADLKDMQKK